MRDRGAGQPQKMRQVKNAKFLHRQGGDDPDTGGIAQGSEGLGKGTYHLVARHGVPGGTNAPGIDVHDLIRRCRATIHCR